MHNVLLKKFAYHSYNYKTMYYNKYLIYILMKIR